MRSAHSHLPLVCTLLLIAAACSKPPSSPKITEYKLETSCSGGGGIHTCVSKNASDNKLGPFDLEVAFVDDRGVVIENTVVRNDAGLEPKGERNFNVSGPASTRSIRILRVTPRN